MRLRIMLYYIKLFFRFTILFGILCLFILLGIGLFNMFKSEPLYFNKHTGKVYTKSTLNENQKIIEKNNKYILFTKEKDQKIKTDNLVRIAPDVYYENNKNFDSWGVYKSDLTNVLLLGSSLNLFLRFFGVVGLLYIAVKFTNYRLKDDDLMDSFYFLSEKWISVFLFSLVVLLVIFWPIHQVNVINQGNIIYKGNVYNYGYEEFRLNLVEKNFLITDDNERFKLIRFKNVVIEK